MNVMNALSSLLPSIGRTLEKAVTDKDLRQTLMHDIKSTVLSMQASLVSSQEKIIVAEAQGGSWIQRSWRPITMLTFVFIIANNYILVPYAVAFGASVPMLDIPPGMWSLLTVGIGGYIGGRTYEKVKKLEVK